MGRQKHSGTEPDFPAGLKIGTGGDGIPKQAQRCAAIENLGALRPGIFGAGVAISWSIKKFPPVVGWVWRISR